MNETFRKWITPFCMSFMFMFAVSISIIGVLLPEVIGEYQVSLSEAGIVTVVQNAGGILALLFCGYLSDRYGKLKVILVLFSLMGAGLLASPSIGQFWGFAALAFILGLASSSLNMVVSAYLADLYEEKRDYYVNLGGVFFGLGSVCGTLYLTLMKNLHLPWRTDFFVLGVVCLVILLALAVALLMMRGRQRTISHEKASGNTVDWSTLRNPRLALYALIGLLYMAHSSAFMAWIPTYFTVQRGFSAAFVTPAMTLYWVAIFLGRVLYTAVSLRISPVSYLLWGNLLGGAAVLPLCVSGQTMTLLLFGVIGLATGAGFQVCLSLTCRDFSSQSGTASSAVSLCASCGGTICCWLVGVLSENVGFHTGIVLIGGVLCAIVPVILFSSLKRKHGR